MGDGRSEIAAPHLPIRASTPDTTVWASTDTGFGNFGAPPTLVTGHTFTDRAFGGSAA